MTDLAEHRLDLATIIAMVLAVVVAAAALRHVGVAEIDADRWRCTVSRPEPRPVSTPQGEVFRTAWVCAQWTER